MIMMKLMNDEGHGDYISNESDDSDDVLPTFISSLPLGDEDFPPTPQCDLLIIAVITPG